MDSRHYMGLLNILDCLPGLVEFIDFLGRALNDISNIGFSSPDTLDGAFRHILLELLLSRRVTEIHITRRKLRFTNTYTGLNAVLKDVHLVSQVMMESLQILSRRLLASFDPIVILPKCIEALELQLGCLFPEGHNFLLDRVKCTLDLLAELLLCDVEGFHYRVKVPADKFVLRKRSEKI